MSGASISCVICNKRGNKRDTRPYGPDHHPTRDACCPVGRAHLGCIVAYKRFVGEQVAQAHAALAPREVFCAFDESGGWAVFLPLHMQQRPCDNCNATVQ